MHVVTTRRQYTDRSGVSKTYRAHLLRRSFREGGKVKNETLGNLSALPDAAVEVVKAVLRGQVLTPAGGPGEAVEIVASRPHGHVAAVVTAARRLGFPELLGPPCRLRDLAFALLVARVVRPGSKLATSRWWADTTLAADLGITEASTDEVYAALDWLLGRQEAIEAALAARHLTPAGMALFDLSSSYVTGARCPLAAFGYSRDRKRGYPQVNYGLLTDPDGRPVAVRVFAGNTADPAAFTAAVDVVRAKFGLTDLVLVGDREMITSARIAALRDLGGFGWVTALRAPDVAALAAADGPLQLSLFDQHNLAEITIPTTPASGWWPAVTQRWPTNGPASAPPCSPPPTPTSARSSPRSPPAGSSTPTRSGSGSARSSTGARWASTTPSTSAPATSASPTTRPASTPKPPSTGSTCCAPAWPPRPCPPPRWCAPTRTSPTSNATSAASRPSTWTCGRSATTPPTGSAPTSGSARWPPTWSGTCAATWPRSPSPTNPRPPAPTRSPPQAAPPPPTAKPADKPTTTAHRSTASAGCSTTWPPSPATPCASPRSPTPPPSNSSPSPPPPNGAPSNSSTPPSRSGTRRHDNTVHLPESP